MKYLRSVELILTNFYRTISNFYFFHPKDVLTFIVMLLGEPIDTVRRSQSHVVQLAMETDIWATSCRIVHPGEAAGSTPRKAAADEYAATLEQTKRKHMPITKRVYMGLPTSKL